MDPSAPTTDARADERFRRLVEVNRLIVAELSLDALLRRVLESATEMVGARHGALLVHGVNGKIEHFLHCGMDAATVAGIAAMPRGFGLLAAVGDQPLRIPSAAQDHRAGGLPAGHPPIAAFLGVPIQSADSVYGTLYLTNPVEAAEFTGEDEDLLRALAATAGIAVQNARLYEEARQRHEWLQVSSEVSTHLLADSGDTAVALRELASAARQLVRDGQHDQHAVRPGQLPRR
jgi:GAF domain-containing protein